MGHRAREALAGPRQSPCLGGITILACRIPPKSGEFNESDVERLREDPNGKVITMAEFLRLPNFRGCKDAAGTLLPPGTAQKVLAEKEKKKKKVEAKAAAKADDSDQAKEPLEILANEAHVSKNASAGRLEALRNQTDKQSPLRHKNVDEHMANEGAGNEHGDENIVDEGHGDNTGGLSMLRTQPSPAIQSGRHLEFVEKPTRDKAIAETASSLAFVGILLS
nr:hypothetical protein [Tanacetum cinerariifolium]